MRKIFNLFSGINKEIFVLKKGCLERYNLSKLQGERLLVPETLIKNQEIIDKAAFLDYLANFLKTAKFQKCKLIIVIDDSLLYTKEIPKNDEQKFLDEIPVNPENIAKLKLIINKKLFLLATNKDLFNSVIEVATTKGYLVCAIIPSLALSGFSLAGGLTQEVQEKAWKNIKTLERFSFIKNQDSNNKSFRVSPLLLLLIFLLLLILALIFYLAGLSH